MELFFDSRGNISVTRVSMFMVFIGFLFLLGSAFSWFLDNETRRSPFDIALPAGAVQWGGIVETGSSSRQVFYQVANGDIQAVVDHYDRVMNEHYGDPPTGQNRETCIRFPKNGDFEDYVPGQGTVPFQHKCTFDRSGVSATQYTIVTIQPGVPNADPALNSEGTVVIAYDQYWQS